MVSRGEKTKKHHKRGGGARCGRDDRAMRWLMHTWTRTGASDTTCSGFLKAVAVGRTGTTSQVGRGLPVIVMVAWIH